MPWELALIFIGLGYLGFAGLTAVVLVEDGYEVLYSLLAGSLWGPALVLKIYYSIKETIQHGNEN